MSVGNFMDCLELYRLSGWDTLGVTYEPVDGEPVPAYTTDDLMGRLPGFTLTKRGDGGYDAAWHDHADGVTIEAQSRSNPATALCRLAIRLFEAGVLIRPEGEART